MTSAKFNDLNNVLDLTLKRDIKVHCADDRMIIRGEFVKSSEIDLSKCGASIKKVHVFAIDTFFVDSNIDFHGKRQELAILAYKWEIIKEATFYLNGTDERTKPQSPFTTTFDQRAGKAGEPGLPGGNAANFFGFFKEFQSNELNLHINTNGGIGGQGQDGSSAYSSDVRITEYLKQYEDCSFSLCHNLKRENLATKCRMDRSPDITSFGSEQNNFILFFSFV